MLFPRSTPGAADRKRTGPSLGQHPKPRSFIAAGPRSVGAFTRSVPLAIVQSSSARLTAQVLQRARHRRPVAQSAATRRADCRASGYPLCERHRGGRWPLMAERLVQGQVDLITFGWSPLLGYSETPCPTAAVRRQTAPTETFRRHVGRFARKLSAPLI